MIQNTTEELLAQEFDRLKAMVVQKNIEYKDSLQNPQRTFLSEGEASVGILARLDDKLNRIRMAGLNQHTVDTVDDLIGYLVHLRISLRKKGIK
jgi:hypothetical protein